MARPQNWAKGLFAKRRIDLSASGEFYAHDYASSTAAITFNSTAMLVRGGLRLSNQANGMLTANSTAVTFLAGIKISNKSTAQLTGNSTGLVVPGKVQFQSKRYLGANTTGYIADTEGSLPTTDEGAAFTLVSNSTGVAVAVNSTGTTWKYLNTTSVQPT